MVTGQDILEVLPRSPEENPMHVRFGMTSDLTHELPLFAIATTLSGQVSK